MEANNCGIFLLEVLVQPQTSHPGFVVRAHHPKLFDVAPKYAHMCIFLITYVFFCFCCINVSIYACTHMYEICVDMYEMFVCMHKICV